MRRWWSADRGAPIAPGRSRRSAPARRRRAEIAPARVADAYQAALTLGTPYVFDPGPAARRSATSACTITSAGPQRREQFEQRQHDRHRDVVRQVRHQRGRCRGQRGVQVQRVGDDHRERRVRQARGDGRAAGPQPAPGRSRRRSPGARPRAARASASPGRDRPRGPSSPSVKIGRAHDTTDRVRVMQEILTECLGRPDAELCGQRADVGRAEQCRGRHGAQSAGSPSRWRI